MVEGALHEILVTVTPSPTIDPSAREMAGQLCIGCYSVWDNPADDEVNARWHRETLKSLEPIIRGHYMGETDLLASPTRAAESLAPGVQERLQEIRRRHDPQGMFYGHIGQA